MIKSKWVLTGNDRNDKCLAVNADNSVPKIEISKRKLFFIVKFITSKDDE